VYGIKKRLEKTGMDEKRIKEIIGNGDLVDIITRMEQSLDSDTVYQILDSCACGGGKDFIKRCEKIGKEIAGKTLSEKINYINGITPDSENIILNADNTLGVMWSFRDNEKYKCVCSAAVKTNIKVSDLAVKKDDSDSRAMPLSYCFCCAGSGRRHLQLQLGVELKTKEVVSSPINSGGEKPCELLFEIADNLAGEHNGISP
jgi:hypothetical protein